METLSIVTVLVELGGHSSRHPHFSATLVSPYITSLNCRILPNSRRDDTLPTGCVSPVTFIFHDHCRVLSPVWHEWPRNTGFPCLLRLIIWTLFKIYPKGSPKKETFAFLLDHPRRCFTLLFPSSATWWLFGVLVFMNFLDLFFFLVLDLGDNYISAIPVGYRILDGLFQVFYGLTLLTVVHIDTYRRSCSDEFTVASSGYIGELFDHDVHLRLPGSHQYSANECIWGAKFGYFRPWRGGESVVRR